MPKRLNSRIPTTDRRRSFHWEKLSPSQWPPCFPLPTNVDRLRTNARFPVACWTTLQRNATRSLKTATVTKSSYHQPQRPGTILSERVLLMKQFLLWSLLTWKCGCKTANKRKFYTVTKIKKIKSIRFPSNLSQVFLVFLNNNLCLIYSQQCLKMKNWIIISFVY